MSPPTIAGCGFDCARRRRLFGAKNLDEFRLIDADACKATQPSESGCRAAANGFMALSSSGMLLPGLMPGQCILQIEPKVLGRLRNTGWPRGHLGSDSTFLPNNVVHGGRRNAQLHRRRVSGDVDSFQKFVPQNFSHMKRRAWLSFLILTIAPPVSFRPVCIPWPVTPN